MLRGRGDSGITELEMRAHAATDAPETASEYDYKGLETAMGLERAHGEANTYARGCRCRSCKDAWAAYCRERKALRVRVAIETPAPIHTIQRGTGRPLTVWRCSCGEVAIGTPGNPYPVDPQRHQFVTHQWEPLSQVAADDYLEALCR